MSLATQDDLECYLSAEIRVVTVDAGETPLDELLNTLGTTSPLPLRHPAPGADVVEWRRLIADLQPQVLLISHSDRLLDRADFAPISTRQILLRTAHGVHCYQWMMIGDRIALVVTGTGPDSIRSLTPAELAKVGGLLRGLLISR